jgi:putative ABC transport system permease protein
MTGQPHGFFSPRAHVEDLLRDIRHVSRGLRRTPGFAIAVILTLALGIGGNTTIFSIVDQVLMRPLPYPNGDELVTVYEAGLASQGHFSVSPANWLDWQRQSRTVATFAAWRPSAFQHTRRCSRSSEPSRLSPRTSRHVARHGSSRSLR